jgi:hypothetical protein
MLKSFPIARLVACPACGSAAGSACVAPSAVTLSFEHHERHAAL